MIHHLTIGHLQIEDVRLRRVRASAALERDIIVVLDEFRDPRSIPEAPTFDGAEVCVTREYVRCVWYSPKLNRRTTEFAIAAMKLGYDVADVEYARIVPIEELQSALESPSYTP
jgi:hypothetical protein